MEDERGSQPRKAFAIIGVIIIIMVVYAGYNRATEGDDRIKEGELNAPVRSHAELTIEFKGEEHKVTIELYEDKAPLTVANFRHYIETGFYDGTIFHRVIENFVVQGGGVDEDGNEKQTTRDAIKHEGNGLPNLVGTVAMARLEKPNTATSQFFVNVQDNPSLNAGGVDEWGYVVFGKVPDPADFDLFRQISYAETDDDDRPLQNVVLVSARMV